MMMGLLAFTSILNTYRYWLPVFLWCLFIFYLSSIPGLSSGLLYDYILRKIAHSAEYGILALLILRAVSGAGLLQMLRNVDRFRNTTSAKMALVVFLSFIYACTDEYHQSFVGSRVGSGFDIAVDTLGSATFMLIFYLYQKKQLPPEDKSADDRSQRSDH